VYKITAEGRKALDGARVKVDELHHELHESATQEGFQIWSRERVGYPGSKPPGITHLHNITVVDTCTTCNSR